MLKSEKKGSIHRFVSQDWVHMNSNYARTKRQCEEATRKSEYVKANNESLPFASIELLRKCGSKMNHFSCEKNVELNTHVSSNTDDHILSAEEILMIAKGKYIQYISQTPDELSMLFHPLNNHYLGLPCEAAEDVELVVFLLASAQTFVHRQLYHVKNLLSMCYQLASPNGNPIKRVVFYFLEALRERIHQETGNVLLEGMNHKIRERMQLQDARMRLHPAIIACHQQLPFGQVTQFTGMQAILDCLSSERRIHLIDLGMKSGLYWIVLMQALSVRHECPVQHLKITAVISSSKKRIEETGKKLSSFAESMNLPFAFFVTDMEDLLQGVFCFETGEAVAVYSNIFLSTMLAWPNRLETLMEVIKNIRPRVMLVTEIEANTNSSAFMDRFIEALFFYGSLFDCLDACMDRGNEFRKTTEGVYLWEGIHNIVTSDGEEWIHRHEKIDFWRDFFAKSGIVEMELSMSSLSQADLILNRFRCGHSCTLDMNGKCLVLGWKGTPINSVSAWKFDQD